MTGVAVLAGGVGAARLLRGLVDVVPPDEVTAIVNTGDDMVLHGLAISPDIDTVTYTLADAIDPERGWGLRDESWQAMEALARYGGATWFRLGDRDLADPLVSHTAIGGGRRAGGGDGRDRPCVAARADDRAGDRAAAADDDRFGQRRG